MQRDIFTPEHDAFRDMVRTFIAREITPYHEQWERDGMVSRDVWLAAGRAGLLGIEIDEKYGGGGNPDYRYYLILDEELAVAGATGPGFAVHNDINGHYFSQLATPEQRERWLPGYCSGELITAIAMTEPGAGSDLQGIRTTAIRDGDHYLLNGTQDLHLQRADVRPGDRRRPDRSRPPATRGSACWWWSAGCPASSAAATWTRSACMPRTPPNSRSTTWPVPAANLLGEEGGGFIALMQNLPRERIAIGATALAGAEKVFADTLAYCQQRQAFGRPIGSFQHSRFVLAEMATELAVARAFTDRAVMEHVAGPAVPTRKPPWSSGGTPSCATG